jgi:hypothetical protein
MNNMFAQRVGRAVGGRPVSTTPDGQRQQSALMVVIEVRSVTRTEPAQADPQLEQIRAEASGSLERTLSDALASDVRARARVRTDDEVLEQMFRVETPAEQ